MLFNRVLPADFPAGVDVPLFTPSPYLTVTVPEAGTYLVHVMVDLLTRGFTDPATSNSSMRCSLLTGIDAIREPQLFGATSADGVILSSMSGSFIVTLTDPGPIVYGCAQTQPTTATAFRLLNGNMIVQKLNSATEQF